MPRLEEDLQRHVVRAAGANHADSVVQIDVEAGAELDRVAGWKAGTLELLSTPELDALPLGLLSDDCLCRSHSDEPFVAMSTCLFGQTTLQDVPIPGDPKI